MAPPNIESQYKELLCPVKDLEQSFKINIAELLQHYLFTLFQGKMPPNFNSAALLLQGSSSIYGKKVEYLHSLASQLHQHLTKQKKDEQGKKENVKEKHRRRTPRTHEILSLDIKRGKDLSCLSKKNAAKMAARKRARRKRGKKMKKSRMPAHLMPSEEDKKGGPLYDIMQEPIGNKRDYALLRCRITSFGWLLLPRVCRSLIPEESNCDEEDSSLEIDDDDEANDMSDELPNSAPIDEGVSMQPPNSEVNSQPIDEGVDMEPPNSEVNSQPIDEGVGMEPPNSEVNSQPIPASMETDQSQGPSQPTSSDVGIDVNCSMDVDVDGDANPQNPAEEAPTSEVDDTAASMSVRHSVRQALKELTLEKNEKSRLKRPRGKFFEENEVRKGRTVVLPRRLRAQYVDQKPDCISDFCARTFFVPHTKLPRKERLLWGGVQGFQRDCQIYRKIFARIKTLRAKNKCQQHNEESDVNVDDIEETELVNICIDSDDEEKENERVANPIQDGDIPIDEEKENERVANPIQDGDIPIDTAAPAEGDCIDLQPSSPGGAEPPHAEPPLLSEPPVIEEPLPEDMFADAIRYIEESAIKMAKLLPPSDIAKNVNKWQKTVKPVLKEIEERKNFDIDIYGSDILNAFEDSNRKQTITFKDFCKGMPKWEIHRYFLALLPLINIGNVSIENEPSEDGTEEQISITLLSRKMHHTELEEFGHSSGEHL